MPSSHEGRPGRTLEIRWARCARVDLFAVLRLVVGAGSLAVAAASDVRTRRVRDPLWVALGTIGLVLLSVELATDSAGPEAFALAAATAILFYAIFYGAPLLDEDGVHLRPPRLLLLAIAALLVLGSAWWVFSLGNGDATAYTRLLTTPAMVLVYQGFYQVGLLRGGADAKGLIALTLLVPLYPNASPFPLLQPTPAVADAMQVFFPFSLVVLVDALILALVVPLGYIVVNLARRDLGAPMWRGTRAPIDRLPAHSWLMERVDARGQRFVVLFPSHKKDEAEELTKLRAAGATRVWVERKVPLLLPILFGFLLAFFVGNLLVGFLTAVLPRA